MRRLCITGSVKQLTFLCSPMWPKEHLPFLPVALWWRAFSLQPGTVCSQREATSYQRILRHSSTSKPIIDYYGLKAVYRISFNCIAPESFIQLCNANLCSSVRDLCLQQNIGFAQSLFSMFSIAYRFSMFCSVCCIPFPQTYYPRVIEADQYYNGYCGYYLSESVSTITPQSPHLYH